MGAFRVEALSNCLLYADAQEYFHLSAALQKDLATASSLEKMTCYATLASLLLQAIANHLPKEETVSVFSFDRIANYSLHESFPLAMQTLDNTASLYFDMRTKMNLDNRSYVVHEVNRYINQHLSQGVSLNDLGEVVCLHPTYLSRVYKEITGVSINQYIAGQRITLAQSMLKDPIVKISQIITATGLNTPSYFTYFFKKHVGMTPQEYRTQCATGRKEDGNEENNTVLS